MVKISMVYHTLHTFSRSSTRSLIHLYILDYYIKNNADYIDLLKQH